MKDIPEADSLMDEESLLILEKKVQKMLDALAKLKKEKAIWEEEKARIKEKVEGILRRMEEITEEEEEEEE